MLYFTICDKYPWIFLKALNHIKWQYYQVYVTLKVWSPPFFSIQKHFCDFSWHFKLFINVKFVAKVLKWNNQEQQISKHKFNFSQLDPKVSGGLLYKSYVNSIAEIFLKPISDFKLPGQISRLVGISERSFSMQNKPMDISFQETLA